MPVPSSTDDQPPEVTASETVDAIVTASNRKQEFRLRREFLQKRVDGTVEPGPLGALVRAGDHRALLLYLLLVTKASAAPWDAALPAAVWARALGLSLPDSKTARSTISKMWLRLEGHGLVGRSRRERLAEIHLKREDGSGADYESPGEIGDSYFRIPLVLWTGGPDEDTRWYQALSLPELTVFLIARSLGDGFWLSYERAPQWYGISADTVARGVSGLEKRELLVVNRFYKKAPLSTTGYTAEFTYTLQPPFGPTGKASRRSIGAPASKTASARAKPSAAATKKKKPGSKASSPIAASKSPSKRSTPKKSGGREAGASASAARRRS